MVLRIVPDAGTKYGSSAQPLAMTIILVVVDPRSRADDA